MNISAFAERLPTKLSSRTLYVKCTPSPATFTERRAVLRTIQNIIGSSHPQTTSTPQNITSDGVDVFRKLKDNSSFILVTNKPETAEKLISESPIRRTIIIGKQGPASDSAASNLASWGSKYNRPTTIAEPINPIPSEQAEATSSADELGLAYRTLTLRCYPANKTYNHLQVVRSNPLHGAWPDTIGKDQDTFISSALRRIIPAGAMAPALRDWETGDQLSRDNTSFAEEASEGASALFLGRESRKKAAQVFQEERERTRRQKEDTPDVMRSPRDYVEKYWGEKPSHPGSAQMKTGDDATVAPQPDYTQMGTVENVTFEFQPESTQMETGDNAFFTSHADFARKLREGDNIALQPDSTQMDTREGATITSQAESPVEGGHKETGG